MVVHPWMFTPSWVEAMRLTSRRRRRQRVLAIAGIVFLVALTVGLGLAGWFS